MPRASPSRVRRHGCSPPLHPLQLAALQLFLGLVAGCFAFEIPLIESPDARAAVAALYSLVVAALVGLYLKTRWGPAAAKCCALPLARSQRWPASTAPECSAPSPAARSQPDGPQRPVPHVGRPRHVLLRPVRGEH
jgi:hypothetical protein